ncbi:TRAP transporter small permease [Pseudonocardia xishanensis]|uniref:Tripartite ATP-independent periplasmic transporters DctQ component domain-containing protein n=1 Tax=Pseudonocardia xishanensis TaxID=630995 RepID=A0ABP8RZ30_9PSEU
MTEHSPRTVADGAVLSLVRRMAHAAATVAGAAVVAMAVLVTLDVVMRWVANRPVEGTLDIVGQWLMPAAGLLCVGLVQINGQHVRVTLVFDNADAGLRRAAAAVCEVASVVMLLWMAYLAIGEAVDSVSNGERSTVVGWLPFWPGHVAVAVALVIATCCAIARLYAVVLRPDLLPEPEPEAVA